MTDTIDTTVTSTKDNPLPFEVRLYYRHKSIREEDYANDHFTRVGAPHPGDNFVLMYATVYQNGAHPGQGGDSHWHMIADIEDPIDAVRTCRLLNEQHEALDNRPEDVAASPPTTIPATLRTYTVEFLTNDDEGQATNAAYQTEVVRAYDIPHAVELARLEVYRSCTPDVAHDLDSDAVKYRVGLGEIEWLDCA